MDSKSAQNSSKLWLIFTLALLSLTVYLFAGYFPDGRKWGINYWGYFSDFSPTLFFAIFAVLLIIVILVSKNWKIEQKNTWPSYSISFRSVFVNLIIAFLGAGVYWLFRTKTHFLGDGYLNLSRLATDQPYVKKSDFGETVLHDWFITLFSERSEKTALLTYELLSTLAGFLFLLAVGIFAHVEIPDLKRRLLFVLGLATGGFGLLFFGYVKQYSWFILSVVLFTLAGVLAMKSKIDKWPVVLLFLAATFFHVFGIILFPALLYLFLRKSPLSRLRLSWRVFLVVTILSIGLGVFAFLYKTNYFFRYSFVPIVPIEITAEGYTLFSSSHLIDFINLVLLVVPAFPILIWLSFRKSSFPIMGKPEYKFLIMIIISSMFTVFIIDPRLGMPRDWDLFSIVGVPLISLLYLLGLDNQSVRKNGMVVCAISIVLSLSILIPRVAALNMPKVAIDHLHNYMNLDKAKSRSASHILKSYYESIGDLYAVNAENERWEQEYPEMQLVIQSGQLIEAKDYDGSIKLCNRAIEINPMLWNAYSNLGRPLLEKGLYDSAYTVLRIAEGINPYFPATLVNLSYALMWKNEFGLAEEALKRAIKYDTTMVQALTCLVTLYKQTGRINEQIVTLKRIVARADAPVVSYIAITQYYVTMHQLDSAAFVYRRALGHGVDSSNFYELFQQNPVFRQYTLHQ